MHAIFVFISSAYNLILDVCINIYSSRLRPRPKIARLSPSGQGNAHQPKVYLNYYIISKKLKKIVHASWLREQVPSPVSSARLAGHGEKGVCGEMASSEARGREEEVSMIGEDFWRGRYRERNGDSKMRFSTKWEERERGFLDMEIRKWPSFFFNYAIATDVAIEIDLSFPDLHIHICMYIWKFSSEWDMWVKFIEPVWMCSNQVYG